MSKSTKKELCEDCGNPLPDPVYENREGGYSEEVTTCPCGAVYTSWIFAYFICLLYNYILDI